MDYLSDILAAIPNNAANSEHPFLMKAMTCRF
jgi:hypothetical protein